MTDFPNKLQSQGMFAQHHFLIQDSDSQTNFQLSQMPRNVACGYTFCEGSDASTHSNSSQNSIQSQKLSRKVHAPLIYAKDDLAKEIDRREHELYHQSAIRKHLGLIENAFSEHKIDIAYGEVQKLKKLCDKTLHQLTHSEHHLIQKIQREMKDVKQFQKIIHEQGWQLQKEKKNLRVSTKIEGNTVGVLVEAYLDVAIQKFLSIITEIDLMKKWMPFMEYSSLQKIVSRNCRIGHCVNNFPIIAKRQSFFQGIGYDRIQHNKTVFMFTRSLTERKDLQKQLEYTVKQTDGAVQLDYRYIILEYYPQSSSEGNLKMAINVDLKLNVPMFILIPATSGFGVDFYNNVVDIAKNFKGSKWQKNVQNNPQFFDFIQGRIKQYFCQ